VGVEMGGGGEVIGRGGFDGKRGKVGGGKGIRCIEL
jgi:hypothetical protein